MKLATGKNDLPRLFVWQKSSNTGGLGIPVGHQVIRRFLDYMAKLWPPDTVERSGENFKTVTTWIL